MKKDRDHARSRKAKAIENASPFTQLFMSAIRSAAVAFLAALTLILLGSLAGYSLDDPASCVPFVALTALYLSFFVCGFVSSRTKRGKPLLMGLFSAGLYLIPILIVSLLIKPASLTPSFPGNRAVIALLTLPCSLLGAFFGNVRVPSKRRSIYRQKRR